MMVFINWATRRRKEVKEDFSRLLNSGFIHVLIVTIGVRGAGFIQQIGLARILEPEELGMAVFVLRLLTMVCVAADLGISTSLLKFSSEPVPEERKKAIYYTALVSVAWVSLISAMVFAVTVLLTGGLGSGEDLLLPLLVGALFIPASSLRKLPPMFMQAQKRIKQASMIAGCVHIVLLVLILLGAYYYRFWGYLIVMICGQVISMSVFLYFTRDSLTNVRADWGLFKSLSNFGFFSMLANFSGIINASLGILMLKWLGESYVEIAIFSVASVVVNGIRLVPQSLLRTAFPYLVSAVNNPAILKRKTDELVVKQGVVVTLVALLAGMSGYWLLPMLFGSQYRASWPTMVVLLFSLVFWAIGAAYGQLQMSLNLVKVNFVISFIQLILNAVLAYFLIPKMGSVGAAAALCISYFLHTILLSVAGDRALRKALSSSGQTHGGE